MKNTKTLSETGVKSDPAFCSGSSIEKTNSGPHLKYPNKLWGATGAVMSELFITDLRFEELFIFYKQSTTLQSMMNAKLSKQRF